MKKAVFVFVALALAVAASARAELSKFKDWDKSPEAYFLTSADRAEWKKVATDDDAEKFIALYWAKRGGEPFRQDISRRIAAADQQFKLARYKRGADSVRGRLLVTLGAPSRVSQSRAQEGVSGEGDAVGLDTRLRDDTTSIGYTWTYDKDRLAAFGIPELRAVIAVDNQRGTDSLQNRAEVEHAIATVAEKSIVNPNATAPAPGAALAPAAASAPGSAPAAAAAPPPPAAAAVIPLPAAAKAALETAAGKPADASFWSGAFRSATGDQYLAFQFYLPADKAPAAAALKFGGVVQDETGKEVGSYWEDAALGEVAGDSRKDRVFDHSVALPPGSYKGTFGLFASESQPPLTSSTVSFKLEPASADFAVSPLLLSNGLVPITKRPGPTDPFVFGTEKPIKVEPKGDHQFSKSDSLWYFYAVANPAFPASAPDAAPAAPAASTTPTAGAAAGPAAAAEAPKPRIMTRINVQKDERDAFAPFSGLAEMQPIGKAYYGSGSEIPLASFEPGYYTFVITVRDLNAPAGSPARMKGVERREDFVVRMPDGSLPPKGAPKAPAPKPKKP